MEARRKNAFRFFGHSHLTESRVLASAVVLDAPRHKQPFEAAHEVLSIYVQATNYIYQRKQIFRPGVHGYVRFSKKHISRNAMWTESVHAFLHDVQLANFRREPEARTYFPPVIKQV